MRVEEIAAAHWKDVDATKALAELVEEVVDFEEPIGTTRLVALLMPDATTKQTKALLSHLYNARVRGLLDGYWTAGKPNGGTFGKPSYVWHRPARKTLSDAERLAMIRKDLGEEQFQKLYSQKPTLPED